MKLRRKNAVKGISFYVDKGEIVTLTRANGAGKTSTTPCDNRIGKSAQVWFILKNRYNKYGANKNCSDGITHVPEGRRIFYQYDGDGKSETGCSFNKIRKLPKPLMKRYLIYSPNSQSVKMQLAYSFGRRTANVSGCSRDYKPAASKL
jgi:ABC-type branched-subunit amino acid transport system ATPase component